jgi:hypothetical protein
MLGKDFKLGTRGIGRERLKKIMGSLISLDGIRVEVRTLYIRSGTGVAQSV